MKVAIVGAGIAGLSLALCLERYGHRVLVIEKAPSLRGGGYMIDFFGPGYDAAEKLGLLPELQKIHFPVPYLMWVDGRGKERITQPYKDLRKLLNNRHFNFLRGDLERLLYEQVKGKDKVEVRFGTTLKSFGQDGGQDRGPVHVSLSDGTTDSFDLLVGADGVHSSVRSMLFGEERGFHRFLGYNTAAFVIDQQQSQETSISTRRDAFQTLTEPHRQVAIYPFSGNRLVAFFIYEAPRELAAYTHEAAVAELQRVYGDMDWVVPGLLECSRQVSDIYFDAVTQIELPQWSSGRVTLVGDACQCVSLLAGQGASMAVFGAYTLAEELSREGVKEGVGAKAGVEAALDQYERRLKPEITKRQASGRRIAHWFVPSNQAQLVLSNLITRSSTWPVVSTFAKRALNSGSKL